MTDPTSSILSGAALLLAGAAFKFAYSMAQRVTSLETKISLFWTVIEKNTSQLLHSPHRPALDELLDKNLRGERLSTDEACRLAHLLQKLIDSNELSGDEKAIANQLMAVTVGKYKLIQVIAH